MLIEIAVPAATLFEVSDRLPPNVDAPVVVIVPPLVNEKLLTFVTVPSENAAALPESFNVTLLLGPAANVPENPVTLFELARLAVIVSAAVESVDVTDSVVPVSLPVPVSVIAYAVPAPSCPLTPRLTVPVAVNALLIEIAVPAAALFEVSDRLPLKVDAPVVPMVPPFVSAKLWTLVTVPSENAAALPESFSVTSLVGPAAYVPENPPTLFELTRLVVTLSAAVESVDVTDSVVAVNEPVPVSLMV